LTQISQVYFFDESHKKLNYEEQILQETGINMTNSSQIEFIKKGDRYEE
jgi:hypothetical protein